MNLLHNYTCSVSSLKERFESGRGECDLEVTDTSSILRLIPSDVFLTRMLSTLD